MLTMCKTCGQMTKKKYLNRREFSFKRLFGDKWWMSIRYCCIPLVNFIWDYLLIFIPSNLSFLSIRLYFYRFSCYSMLFAASKLMMILGRLSWVKIIKIDRFEMAHVHWTYKYLYRPHGQYTRVQIDLAVLQKNIWWCYCVDLL